MRRESPRPPARRARALASPALPARPRRVARRLSLFRVRLGGAGLPRTGRPQRPRGTRHRLLTSHLERHVSVRPGALAPAWRSLLAGVRAAEPLRADGAAGNPARFARAAEADRELNLRPFAVGLLRADRASLSMMGFILLMLSTVTFDGIMATPAWAWLEDILFNLLPGPGAARLIAAQTMGLIAFPVLFLAVYLVVIRCVVLVSGAGRSVGALAPIFAFTLVPIAIAYHLAHYLSFLLIQGQLIIPLASDPFGVGWNLFGTAGYRTNIGAVGARFAWLTAVIAIVAGHIIAVYLAHVLAMVALGGGARALRSQYPVTALMVGYTMVSLWILAQPIVESGLRSSAEERPGVIAVPAAAMIPEAGTGRLRPVGGGRTAPLKLTYRLLAAKFHDGTAMTPADLLYAYAFAYRWGARAADDHAMSDPGVARSTALIRERLAGLRVVRVERTARTLGEIGRAHV